MNHLESAKHTGRYILTRWLVLATLIVAGSLIALMIFVIGATDTPELVGRGTASRMINLTDVGKGDEISRSPTAAYVNAESTQALKKQGSIPAAINARPRERSALQQDRAAPVDDQTVLAQVNGKTLFTEDLYRMVAVDRVMVQLSGQQTDENANDGVERLINGELVLQAAQQAGFERTSAEASEMLNQLLLTMNKSREDLALAVAIHELSEGEFNEYLSQLLVIDEFSHEQAVRLGITVTDYVAQLQDEARISFGAAAAILNRQTAPLTLETHDNSAASPLSLTQRHSEVSRLTIAGDQTAPLAENDGEVSPPHDGVRGVGVGNLIPTFALPVLNHPSQEFQSQRDLIGKPTVLSFWTTWCPYCRRQTPVLVDAYARHSARGIAFVGINVKESREQVASYISENSVPYPIALDSDGEVAALYHVGGFPTTYFLDVQGRIVARHIGVLDATQLNHYIMKLDEGVP